MKPWAKRPWIKGTVIAALQVVLVASLGAKLLHDRATLPRVWVQAAPFDPDMPIRGRYVSLQLFVEPQRTEEAKKAGSERRSYQPVVLRVENDRRNGIRERRVWRWRTGDASHRRRNSAARTFSSRKSARAGRARHSGHGHHSSRTAPFLVRTVRRVVQQSDASGIR